ncbi:MAG: hypothetical protein OXF93_05560 [Acidobacteria bacterium]|nr:hypothetical protein [Acidobacteriota bacterium]
MFGSRVKIDKALLDKAKRYAGIAGYANVDEFIAHALEKEIAKLEDADSEDEIRKRLKGLGYIS